MNSDLAYLRADVSRSLGLGHISRAIAMGRILERSGIRVIVFCRELDFGQEHAISKINANQDIVQKIVSEAEFISALERKEAKYVFVDLREDAFYAASVLQMKSLFSAYRTICFDDFFNEELKFDLFVRPWFHKSAPVKNVLSGLQYTVFPNELMMLAPSKETQKNVTRVLISLGGSDPFCATPVLVCALRGIFPALHFTVVVGPGFVPAERKVLVALARQYLNIEYVLEPEHLGHLYMASDFAIISGGQTKFEAALFGIPSFIFGNSRQEEELSKEFAELGASVFMGSADQLDPIHLKEEFVRLIAQSERLDEMSRKGRQILDIHGGERIIEYIKHNLS